MNLPTCPACGQSVLDDDPTECPFCGSSMKAPKGSKPPGKPTAPDKKSAGGSAPAAKTKNEKPDDADPFAFDSVTTKNVVALLPRPQQGRTHKIVCPMCETPGYSSSKAAGRQVKCANEECMVPIFTAPTLERPVEAPPPPPPPSKAKRYTIMGLVSVVIIAVGVWFSIREDRPTINRRANNPDQLVTVTKQSILGKDENPLDQINQENNKKVDWDQLSPDEIKKQALEATIEAARTKEDNRSRVLCRRLAAEAHALAGSSKSADEQFDLLEREATSYPYYYVPPLIEQAWRLLADGKQADAGKKIDAAFKLSDKIPRRGRASEIIKTSLASALAASGRIDDAQTILNSLSVESKTDPLSVLTRLSLATKEYDLDRLAFELPLIPWTSAHEAIVTAWLAEHEQTKSLEAWIMAQSDAVLQMNCLAQWGEQDIRRTNGKGEIPASLTALAEQASPPARAYVWSRLAQQYARFGNKPQAQALIAQARELLSQFPEETPSTLPNNRNIHDLSAIQSSPEKQLLARAWSELAFADAELGENDAAWQDVSKVMQVCRSMGPSPTAVRNRYRQAEGDGAKSIQAELKKSLELKTDDQARLAYNRFRRHLDQLSALADERYDLQVHVLSRSARWNLGESLAEEVLARSTTPDENAHEPYLLSPVPHWILYHSRKQGEEDAYPRLREAMTEAGVVLDPRVQLTEETLEGVINGDFDNVNRLLSQSQAELDWIYQWTLRLPCQLAQQQKWDAGFRFLLRQKDLAAREEGLFYLSALAAQHGQEKTLWRLIRTEKLVPTETAHASLGILTGSASTKK